MLLFIIILFFTPVNLFSRFVPDVNCIFTDIRRSIVSKETLITSSKEESSVKDNLFYFRPCKKAESVQKCRQLFTLDFFSHIPLLMNFYCGKQSLKRLLLPSILSPIYPGTWTQEHEPMILIKLILFLFFPPSNFHSFHLALPSILGH